jgi:hypothetical protein
LAGGRQRVDGLVVAPGVKWIARSRPVARARPGVGPRPGVRPIHLRLARRGLWGYGVVGWSLVIGQYELLLLPIRL